MKLKGNIIDKRSILEGVSEGRGIPATSSSVPFLKSPNQGKIATIKQLESMIVTLLAFFDLVREFCTTKSVAHVLYAS